MHDRGSHSLLSTCSTLAAAQTGKLHFGVVLGWSVVGSTVLWFVANNIGGGSADAPDGGAPGLYDCCCLLGYCLLPLIAHALASLLIPKCGSSFILKCYFWSCSSRNWCLGAGVRERDSAGACAAVGGALGCEGAQQLYKLSTYMDGRGAATLALAVLAVLWAARIASRLFVRRSPALEEHAYLLAYPCLLVFTAFALLNVY